MSRVIKKVSNLMRGMLSLLSAIAIPVMVVMISSNNRRYHCYDHGFYDLDYWWEILILFTAISFLVGVVLRRKEYINKLLYTVAGVGTTVFYLVLLTKTWYLVEKVFDSMVGADAPFAAIIMAALGIFVVFGLISLVGFIGTKKIDLIAFARKALGELRMEFEYLIGLF